MIINVLHVIFDNDEGVINCLISGEEKQTPKLTVPSELQMQQWQAVCMMDA